jgi:hypothetical protein
MIHLLNRKPGTDFHEHGPAHPPLPIRSSGKRRSPIEARGDWDPWLPLKDAYPEIPPTLRTFTWIVLALALLTLMFLVFVQMAF